MNLQRAEETNPVLGEQEFFCELLELGQNEQGIKCWEWWKGEDLIIKCDHCGKFIFLADLYKCKNIFIPDTDYSVEENLWICEKCTKNVYDQN